MRRTLTKIGVEISQPAGADGKLVGEAIQDNLPPYRFITLASPLHATHPPSSRQAPDFKPSIS